MNLAISIRCLSHRRNHRMCGYNTITSHMSATIKHPVACPMLQHFVCLVFWLPKPDSISGTEAASYLVGIQDKGFLFAATPTRVPPTHPINHFPNLHSDLNFQLSDQQTDRRIDRQTDPVIPTYLPTYPSSVVRSFGRSIGRSAGRSVGRSVIWLKSALMF